MNAILEISGCCGRYRARLTIRPSPTGIITLESFADDHNRARRDVYELAGHIALPGLDLAEVKDRSPAKFQRKPR